MWQGGMRAYRLDSPFDFFLGVHGSVDSLFVFGQPFLCPFILRERKKEKQPLGKAPQNVG